MISKGWLAGSLLVAAYLFLPSALVAGPVVGQVDTFEDGTTQGWIINLLGQGSPPPEARPANIPTGGPGGADDNYLRLTSVGGTGPGNRLVTLNLDPRWTGDFIAAGVNAITMDVNNLGSSELALRLLFEHAPAGGPPTDVAFSTDAVIVAAGGGWTRATFLIDPGSLTAAEGSVVAALSGVDAIRIYHSPAPQSPGPPVVGRLGVDNITAAAVPEPGSLALLAAGLGASLAGRRRAARR